jgi:hypothetical protein
MLFRHKQMIHGPIHTTIYFQSTEISAMVINNSKDVLRHRSFYNLNLTIRKNNTVFQQTLFYQLWGQSVLDNVQIVNDDPNDIEIHNEIRVYYR